MKSNYEVDFVPGLDHWLEFDLKQRRVKLATEVKKLREDLRSLVIDEAIRVGQYYEQLANQSAKQRKESDLKREAQLKAREISIERYGRELREESFGQLDKGRDKNGNLY